VTGNFNTERLGNLSYNFYQSVGCIVETLLFCMQLFVWRSKRGNYLHHPTRPLPRNEVREVKNKQRKSW